MIPTDYQCDGQMNLTEYIESTKPIGYGSRGCKVCEWRTEKGCRWNERRVKNEEPKHKPDCSFLPDTNTIPRMCANCMYGNMFEYKSEYEGIKGFANPTEEPNIYCTHPEGSLNRRTLYKDREAKNFGATKWDRQHEFDTCDRWELGIGYGGYPLCDTEKESK